MRTVEVIWQGRPVDAADPDRIGQFVPTLSEAVIRRTEQAAAAVQRIGDRATGPLEVAARLLLRAEGLASSAIEGLRAPAADVAIAELTAGSDHGTAAWVADNLAVVYDALSSSAPMTLQVILAWHRRLMTHATGIEAVHIGAWRDRLGWVGGSTPLTAAHVAAPAAHIPALIDDLCRFVARGDIDPVTQAAIAHAQFETIHPFADGNGRIGRVLIGWILATRLRLPVPPPVSTVFARDIGGYLSGLALYRQGSIQPWVSWFADAVMGSATRTGRVLDAVDDLRTAWSGTTSDLRADSAARRLLEHLPAHPVLNTATVATVLGVSTQTARLALDELVQRGVLSTRPPRSKGAGRPQRWWVADDLLVLLGG